MLLFEQHRIDHLKRTMNVISVVPSKYYYECTSLSSPPSKSIILEINTRAFKYNVKIIVTERSDINCFQLCPSIVLTYIVKPFAQLYTLKAAYVLLILTIHRNTSTPTHRTVLLCCAKATYKIVWITIDSWNISLCQHHLIHFYFF